MLLRKNSKPLDIVVPQMGACVIDHEPCRPWPSTVIYREIPIKVGDLHVVRSRGQLKSSENSAANADLPLAIAVRIAIDTEIIAHRRLSEKLLGHRRHVAQGVLQLARICDQSREDLSIRRQKFGFTVPLCREQEKTQANEESNRAQASGHD